MPEILITGFPNSGTSFLCHLVVLLGKSPGNYKDLKGPDWHNRWGYFENLKMREVVWKFLPEKEFKIYEKGFLPDRPYTFKERELKVYRNKIIMLANYENIQVYKDNALPLFYKIFPSFTKILIIRRDPLKCYLSSVKGGHSRLPLSFKEFSKIYKKYYNLVKIMMDQRESLEVNYEHFQEDFGGAVFKIGKFIRVNIDEIVLKKCKKAFRPRKDNRLNLIIGKTVGRILNKYLFKI